MTSAAEKTFVDSRHLVVLRDVAYTSMASPLGTLWIAAGPRGVLRVDSAVDELQFVVALEQTMRVAPRHDPAALAPIVEQLDEYFAGRRQAFDLAVDLDALTPFQRAVLRQVLLVPYGSVRSYGEIAHAIGKPGAARAVGTAVAMSPIGVVVPCHRIVRGDGTPGEYALRTLGHAGQALKLRLLALEGYAAW